ncbi:hypothetical protein H3C70_02385 [Patescibacteria group bacterium]|nr:hypothetical protein [Patescibacteria group bacterium]
MVEFNPGHLDKLKQLRDMVHPGEDKFPPDELAKRAEVTGQIEEVLHLLNQELGNIAFQTDFFHYLIEDLEKLTQDLTEETITAAVEYLEQTATTLKKGNQVTQAIQECSTLIQEASAKTEQAGQQTLINQQSLEYIQLINRDYQRVRGVMDAKGEEFKAAYLAAEAAINAYLDKE